MPLRRCGWLLATRPIFWNATKAGAWRWWKGDEDESDVDSDDEGVVRDDMVASDDADDGKSSDDGDMDAE